MRFHTRRLLFMTWRVERSSFTAATCCSLSFISPYSLTHFHTLSLYPFFLSLSPSFILLRARVSKADGRIQAESTLYIYSEVQHISSIHYSLWAAFSCSFVMCFLHRSCSRRTDYLPCFSYFFLPLPLSLFFFHPSLRPTLCIYRYTYARQ